MAAMAPIDIGNMSMAISDTYYTVHGGLFKSDYKQLLSDLEALKQVKVLHEPYLVDVLQPFLDYLYGLREAAFSEMIQNQCPEGRRIQEVAEALLQRNYQGKYLQSAYRDLVAFQAVVTSIYNSVSPVKTNYLPPLVKWGGVWEEGEERKSAYTIPADKTKLRAGVVSLIPSHRVGGILAWSSLGHEVAGHNFLNSHPKLIGELANKVHKAIQNKLKNPKLAQYWKDRTEELASDVLGVLNTGPSAVIGFIGYIRGASKDGVLRCRGPYQCKAAYRRLRIFSESGKVDIAVEEVSKRVRVRGYTGPFGVNEGESTEKLQYEKQFYASDNHPIDVLRVYAMSRVIELLDINEEAKQNWVNVVENEADRDLKGEKTIFLDSFDKSSKKLDSISIPLKDAIDTAKLAAYTFAITKLACMGKKSLMEIIQWNEGDQTQVELIRTSLKEQKETFESFLEGKDYSRHVVAAAVIESLCTNADIPALFMKMKAFLIQAHQKQPFKNRLPVNL